eukprot:gnl/MRDRNA2_/MRDRNA2_34188_c0_seq1.p1 gnl/MRDRNA2_/MRDRNA2_34188_c0~~gnl/MRDRNA2_/MRDRNA2_34188_c0_seq1.p1  ORF type:complete len:368 (+),score=63.25 gnl/MRDRNA2_/MRDRNA2_34188_c0_seq1:87-1190(+)
MTCMRCICFKQWVSVATAILAVVQHQAYSIQVRGNVMEGQQPQGNSGWHDMACFSALSHFGLKASETDIVFRQAADASSAEVWVVQDPEVQADGGVRRILVFKDGQGKCNSQASIACSSIVHMPGEVRDDCDSKVCEVDAARTVQLPGAGFIRSMTSGLLSLLGVPSPQILSIGLGSGQLALAIQHQIPGAKQTVVELSQSVVDAAGCFGGGNFQIVHADGRSFLERSADHSYDAILVDVADGYDRVPSCFTTLEFFHTVNRTLQPKGILLMNVHTGKTLHNDLKDLLPAVKQTFGEVQLGQAPGLANAIIMARINGDEGVTEKHSSNDDDTLLKWYADAAFQDVGNGIGASDNTSVARTDAQVNCN